jgi:hypothetical protein
MPNQSTVSIRFLACHVPIATPGQKLALKVEQLK